MNKMTTIGPTKKMAPFIVSFHFENGRTRQGRLDIFLQYFLFDIYNKI